MKINAKKLMVFVLTLALVFILLAGCGGSGSGGSGTSSPQGGGPAASNSGAGDAAAGEDFPEVKITFGTVFGSTHNFAVMDQMFFDELKEQANIIVEPYWSGTLVSPITPYQELQDGVADATYVIPGTEADRFYLADKITTFYSWGSGTPRVVYETVSDFLAQYEPFAAEYEGVVPYSIGNSGECLYFITKTPVRTLDDVKGMTIRIAGDAQSAMIKAYGGEPVRLQPPELMEALEKGVIDGCIIGAETLKSDNFADVCKYATATHLVDPYYVCRFISQRTFDTFTEAQKSVFMELAKKYDYYAIEDGVRGVQAAKEYSEPFGVEFLELPAEDLARLDQSYASYSEEVVAELNSKGYQGDEIFSMIRSLLEKNEAEYGK